MIPPTVFRYEAYAGVSLLTGLVAFWVLPPQMADRRSFLYADALGSPSSRPWEPTSRSRGASAPWACHSPP
ncbi:MAG: hypothetical protein ACP5LG_04385 [Conexivisphaera sp.]